MRRLTGELVWRKSSHSGDEGGNCLEVARGPAAVHVRDSTRPHGPVLTVSGPAWTAAVAAWTAGRAAPRG